MGETVEEKEEDKRERQTPMDLLATAYMMKSFIKYSYTKGDEEDKNFAHFLLKNWAKGVLIANTILLMFYLPRFRTYRNSYLGMMHFPATLIGTANAVIGAHNLFFAYLFNKGEIRE